VLEVRPIGVIHSPFTEPRGTPIRPKFARGGEGRVVVDEAYGEALAEVEGFERLWLLYWLDRAGSDRTSADDRFHRKS
jgi:tRNA (Thr-GGU) A37 N-methylase